ncbi:hypothetical protein BCEP4_500009 [Burkholderia cepacia]|nr:lysR family regulatory domain protein [Burkholderia cepacia]CAG9268160.1 hypothetical protein BCEP4_500009 [Burkholderia cepacia]
MAAYAGKCVAAKAFEQPCPMVTSASPPLSMIGDAFCADLRDAFARMREKGAA